MLSTSNSNLSLVGQVGLGALGAACVLDGVLYLWDQWRVGAPATRLVVPLFYGLARMLGDPTGYWENLERVAQKNQGVAMFRLLFSTAYFVTFPELVKKVMVDHDFEFFAHPNAKHLFTDHNLIYMPPKPHKTLRVHMMPALTAKNVLAKVAKQQYDFVVEAMNKISKYDSPRDLRVEIRDLNSELSQLVYIGYRFPEEERKQMADDLVTLTIGFISFPLPIPGMGLYKAIQARKRLLVKLQEAAKMSFEEMNAGKEPICMLDNLTVALSEEKTNTDEYTPSFLGCAVLDMLFAAQDATTSALVWTLAILDQFPNTLEKIRKEVLTECDGSSEGLTQAFNEKRLPLVRQAAVAALRYKPPVPMAPHKALKEVELGPYTIPKGSLIFPSITGAAKHVEDYNVFAFDKPRDPHFMQTMVFGAGQHKCMGRLYAEQLVAMFIAGIAMNFDLERTMTKRSHDYVYLPTLYPYDSIYKINKRASTEEPVIEDEAKVY